MADAPISCIGYWDDEVIAALDRISLRRFDETGDHALSALLSLRSKFVAPVVETYLKTLHARIPAGPNLHQLASARVIGNPQTAALVWSHWLARHFDQKESRGFLVSFARTLLTEIAARVREPDFTFQVWTWLVELSRQQSDGLDNVFSPNSSLINRLDLSDVVPELVRQALRTEAHHRYIYYLRVLESERPAHMAGWDTIPTTDFEAVRTDASHATGMTGRFSTAELYQKEAAWDILLCRGVPSILPPFSETLANESGYVIHRFLELGSCLRLDPLPRLLAELIAGTANAEWDDQQRLVAQIGAIGAARGAGTREAFDALLNYRQLGEGVLLSVVGALAETALIVVESGDRSTVEQLFTNAENSPRSDTRGACSAALASVLEEGVLSPSEVTRAIDLFTSSAADPYARREFLFALATRPPEEVPSFAINFAENAVASPPVEESRDPRPAALALLARQPGARSDPSFLTRLGLLEKSGEAVASSDTLKGVAPHVVGRYFAAEPTRFGSAVATLLRDGDVSVLAHVLSSIREVGVRNPSAVVNALVTRLRRADSGRVADPALLHVLAAIAPDRLLADGCVNMTAWLPQARADLADTLGGLGSLSTELADARFRMLTRLAGDGVYAVRRAAYRAAALCDTERFTGLALSWARWREPGRQGPRRYAAECAGWLLSADDGQKLEELGWDQEPAVREAYERSLREQRERAAAREFESHVLGVGDPDGVILGWRCGIGLSRVGDDSTIRRLADRIGAGLPPSVRFWLRRVQKAVERRWSEVTRKWPEPWYARPGHLEQFSGVVRDDNGKEVALSGTLWLMPSEAPEGLSSWGGWATCERRWKGDGQLLLPGRLPAKILVYNSLFPACEVQFGGNGPYPLDPHSGFPEGNGRMDTPQGG